METRLAPIEKPAGLMLKLVYAMSRRQFGKVLTPIKVVYGRMPLRFGMWSGKISSLDQKLKLSPMMTLLIREQVAHINVCTFCTDIGRAFVIKSSMPQEKFDALNAYRTSPLFTEAERTALEFAEEMTRQKKASDELFGRLRQHFSEREICEIAWVIATEHYYNLMNLSLDIHSDMLCDIQKMRKK
jgi:alkylhydroperoxidase family enzyme